MITLDLPVALNATYRTGKGNYYKSAEAKAWEEKAMWEIKSQWKRQSLDGPVYVGLTYFLKRDRDIDSGLKLSLDVLAKSGVYLNDSQVCHLNVKKYKGDPRVEIEVEACSL